MALRRGRTGTVHVPCVCPAEQEAYSPWRVQREKKKTPALREHPLRTLDSFDPRCVAILLIGEDKTGNDRWYAPWKSRFLGAVAGRLFFAGRWAELEKYQTLSNSQKIAFDKNMNKSFPEKLGHIFESGGKGTLSAVFHAIHIN